MPPRYAYWTILIGQQPTSFRARDREELLPTLVQLQRTQPDAQMKWFAHGKLWDSPEQQQWAQKNKKSLQEKRNAEWRPGGAHKDPRAKFQKPKGPRQRPPSGPSDERPRTFDKRGPKAFDKRGPRPFADKRGARPFTDKRGPRPFDDKRGARPFADKRGPRPFDARAPRGTRPGPPRRRKPEPEDR